MALLSQVMVKLACSGSSLLLTDPSGGLIAPGSLTLGSPDSFPKVGESGC